MDFARYRPVWVCIWLIGRVVQGWTTPFPTSTFSPTPADGCLYNGQIFPNGATIAEDPNKCHGMYCEGNSIIAWDHKCFLKPPTCLGDEERVEGECCPICHTTSTTTPQSTTTPMTTPKLPENACLYNGTVYANNETFALSSDGCGGKECHYGIIRPWRKECQPVENCTGTVTVPEGHCCDVCLPPEGGCYIRGKSYNYNDVTNADPCRFCRCVALGEERCLQPQCKSTDCAEPYRPEGECCYTCGIAGLVPSLLLTTMLITTVRTLL